MVRELNEILRDTVAIAEEQVEAARNLDVAALTEATGCREHLLDELNQAMEGRRSQASAALSEETEGLVFQLADLDARAADAVAQMGVDDTATFQACLEARRPAERAAILLRGVEREAERLMRRAALQRALDAS